MAAVAQQQMRFVAPPAPAAAAPAPAVAAAATAPANPAANVPDVVEDRRADAQGNIIAVRHYTRGRLLGKVRGDGRLRPRRQRRAIVESL